MRDSDKQEFAQLVTGISEIYGKPISTAGLRIWWAALSNYEYDQVRKAFTAHTQNTKRGSWMPTPADIVRHLDGEPLTVDQVLGMAIWPRDPLGVLFRIQIGSWNLHHLTPDKLKPFAQACIDRLPEFRAKIAQQDYAENERIAIERVAQRDSNTRLLQ